jgi:DNA-nicking Smr family endonuclease
VKPVQVPRDPDVRIDLHGLAPHAALRRLAQELHACRVRRTARVLVITGVGWGNPQQRPVLRPKVEAWLNGPEGKRLGVLRFQITHKGGALDVELRTDAAGAP